jgi:hypothetical protein
MISEKIIQNWSDYLIDWIFVELKNDLKHNSENCYESKEEKINFIIKFYKFAPHFKIFCH